MRSESVYGNKGVWSDRAEGSVVVSLMEGFIVVDGLERAAKAFISGWRSCGGWRITVSTHSYVVAA